MSDQGGPWGAPGGTPQPPPAARAAPRPGPGRRGLGVGLLLLAVLALVFALGRAFPGALHGAQDWTNLVYLFGFLLLVAAGLSRMGRIAPGRHLKHAAIWAGIIAVLALGVAFKDELASAPGRLKLAFSGGDPVARPAGELVVPQDSEGAFVVVGRVDGQRVRFVVDTGATDTVLSPADARRLGVDVAALRYDSEAETANGIGRAALWRVRRLEVGSIAIDDMTVSINQAPMSTSLLGMSFLKRLDGFEVRGRTLILRPRKSP